MLTSKYTSINNKQANASLLIMYHICYECNISECIYRIASIYFSYVVLLVHLLHLLLAAWHWALIGKTMTVSTMWTMMSSRWCTCRPVRSLNAWLLRTQMQTRSGIVAFQSRRVMRKKGNTNRLTTAPFCYETIRLLPARSASCHQHFHGWDSLFFCECLRSKLAAQVMQWPRLTSFQ